MGNEKRQLGEGRIYLTSKHYMSIGVLVAIGLWIISTTYWLVNEFQVSPLENEVETAHESLLGAERDVAELTGRLDELNNEYQSALKATRQPVLMEPTNAATVIGRQIIFRWDYRDHSEFQQYYITIRSLSNPNQASWEFNVYDPGRKKLILPTGVLGKGEYIWRIVAGFKSEEPGVIQGPSSQYQTFAVYDSVLDRIKSTKTLLVGMSPNFTGGFNYLDPEGTVIGPEVDLIQLIAEALSEVLDIRPGLKIKIKQIRFDQLLQEVQTKAIDIAISSITSTKDREEKYRGLRFTSPYFKTNPVLIEARTNTGSGASINEKLSGKVIGASVNTTNEQAAIYLEKRYDSKVSRTEDGHQGLLIALENKEIDYALVDETFKTYFTSNGFSVADLDMGSLLAGFYEEIYGTEGEYYAMAVFEEKLKGTNLLAMINTILKNKEPQVHGIMNEN